MEDEDVNDEDQEEGQSQSVLETKRDDDIDSQLTEEKTEEKVVKIQLSQEAAAEETKVQYSEEDLEKLVSFFKDMTTLYGLDEKDWNSNNELIIRTFLLNPKELTLFIFYDGSRLTCDLDFPPTVYMDLMYFIRKPFEIFEVESFHDQIVFGNLLTSVEGSILHIIENLYAPILFNSSNWPESVKNYFCNHLHSFLEKYTDIHFKLLNLTVLYVPKEIVNIPLEKAMKDKELIKHLEGIVVYWTKQIRGGLQFQSETGPEDTLTPLDEHDLWISRYENLSGLEYQLQDKTLGYVTEILVTVQSTYINQFLALTDEIQRGLKEAKSNIEYLSVLLNPCQNLRNAKTLIDIPPHLPKILHLIRYIWCNSPFYNVPEKVVKLVRLLSNQLLQKCKESINLSIVFERKRSREGIRAFEASIQCLTDYIKAYVKVSECHNMLGEKPWNIDRPQAFNHVDSFIQRCKDMIEICEAMIHFGRFDETEEIPKPSFSGCRSPEYELWIDKVEDMFSESLRAVAHQQDIALDVQKTDWYDHVLLFKGRMKDIDVVIENLVNAIFADVPNVEEGIENLAALFNYSRRVTLRALVERKTLTVYNMFKQEIYNCKQEITAEVLYPARLPCFSGRAVVANAKKNRLQTLRKMFAEANWMLPCSIAKEVFDQYDKLISDINDSVIKEYYRKWVDSTPSDVQKLVQQPLMRKNVHKSGMLECNMDNALLSILREAECWEMLEYSVPSNVKNVYDNHAKIKLTYDTVVSIVLDYNKIIESLSEEELLLFKPLIALVEKKISPGLTKLTWASDMEEDFIIDCCNNTAELQLFLDDYKTCNLQIVKLCGKICDTVMLSLHVDQALSLKEVAKKINNQIDDTITFLVESFNRIIQYLIFVYEGFESQMSNMANEWIKYINNFDTLVEEALKICCRNSLDDLFQNLHGDDTIAPTPILSITCSLSNNEITFEPNLNDVANVIYKLLPNIVDALKVVPRLTDKFQVGETIFSPYLTVIEKDAECNRLKNLLTSEVNMTISKIKSYMDVWEPFRDLWEVNKELFMTKYESQQPDAADFDANIGRYTEVANNVQIQETVAVICFIRINFGELKKAIINHCSEWQKRLCELLKQLTMKKINKIYEYIQFNSTKVMRVPQNLSDMEVALANYDQLVEEVPSQEELFPQISEQIQTLDKYNVEIGNDYRNLEKKIPSAWAHYLEVLDNAEKMLSYSKDAFKTLLLEKAEVLKDEANLLLDHFSQTGPFSSDWSAEKALAYINDLKVQLKACRATEKRLRDDLSIFDLTLGDTAELTKLEKELAVLEIVWQYTDDWNKAWEKYRGGNFWEIETEDMEVTAQTLFRRLTKLSKELRDKGWEIVEYTRSQVDAFRRTLPLLGDLKNKAMRARHWDRVREEIGRDFDETSPEFNLETIFAMEMHKYAEQIGDISNAATMELQIEQGIAAIVETWRTMSFEMVQHKDKGMFRIKGVEDCFTTLEDNMMQLSTMKSTRFVEPFAKEVDYWERSLSYILECIELCLQVQRQYLYLENIFGGEDIRKQLPRESGAFDKVTDDWLTITSRMYRAKTAFKATHFEPPPLLFNKCTKLNEKLELIQRALERYLETKRHIFPRFYFISNDDMLEILGNSKKPEVIQPHLKKLFDNLNKLKLQKAIGSGKIEALGMFSDDGEYMDFVKVVVIDGPAEAWLLDTENQMRATLRKEIKPCRMALKKMLGKRDKWLLTFSGQLCNACSQGSNLCSA